MQKNQELFRATSLTTVLHRSSYFNKNGTYDEPKTIFSLFNRTVRIYGEEKALSFKVNVDSTVYESWTWNEYYRQCLNFAKSLLHFGFKQFECTNIMGFNSKEWFVSHFGTIAAGGIPAGIYPSNLAEACKYISEHSKARIIILEDNKQLKKYVEICSQLTHVKALVVYKEDPYEGATASVPIYSWDSFIRLGENIPDSQVENRLDSQDPDQCACLIYTSGTTGPPKAVMLSHDNITWTCQALARQFPELGLRGNGSNEGSGRTISFLPLSHIAAQMLDLYVPTLIWGSQLFFAQPDALKGSLVQTMKEVRPTFFFGVPRVFEKISEVISRTSKNVKGLKRMIVTWAKKQALTRTRHLQYDGMKNLQLNGKAPKILPDTPLESVLFTPMANPSKRKSLKHDRYQETWQFRLAKKMVLSKVKSSLGLDCTLAVGVAAAPMPPETTLFFASLGIPIYESFGQSECTGPHTTNTISAWKIGTCGRPLPGTESRIDKNTGELCYRGRHIFMGYLGMPEKTEEAIDGEGWLHSGDVAVFDEDHHPDIPKPSGFLKITGRIKELIITAGGENIPPVLIENEFMKAIPALSACMVVGDKRKFLVILLCLKVVAPKSNAQMEILDKDGIDTSMEIGSFARTVSEVQDCSQWSRYLNNQMKVANSKATSAAQIIQKWALLPRTFSEEEGELTPTLKIKRSVVADKYADLIQQLYAA